MQTALEFIHVQEGNKRLETKICLEHYYKITTIRVKLIICSVPLNLVVATCIVEQEVLSRIVENNKVLC